MTSISSAPPSTSVSPTAPIDPPEQPKIADAPEAQGPVDGMGDRPTTLVTGQRASALPAGSEKQAASPDKRDELMQNNERLDDRVEAAAGKLQSLHAELRACKDPERRAELEGEIKEAHQDLLDAFRQQQQFQQLLEAFEEASLKALGVDVAPGAQKIGNAEQHLAELMKKLEGATDPAEKAALQSEIKETLTELHQQRAALEGAFDKKLAIETRQLDAAEKTVARVTTQLESAEARVAALETKPQTPDTAREKAALTKEITSLKTALTAANAKLDKAAAKLEHTKAEVKEYYAGRRESLTPVHARFQSALAVEQDPVKKKELEAILASLAKSIAALK